MSTPAARAVASGARDQVARLLKLVPYLHAQDHDEVRLDEAATALGVTEKVLVKDLRVLFLCGLPGGYPDDLIDVDIDSLIDPEGDRVIRVSNADYLARPLRLTPTEATAVIVALRTLRTSADASNVEAIDRALAKLEQAAAAGAAGAVDPDDDTADPSLVELRDRLEKAARDFCQVRLTYWVPARDETSDRVVDPRAVVMIGGAHYLDAWCHSAEAPRSFRLDRIEAAEVLSTPVAHTERSSTVTEGFFTQDDKAETVTLRLEPEARWVAEYYATTDVRPRADGAVEVDLVVADVGWLTRLLLRVAPYASVISSGEGSDVFTDSLHETARDALGLYEADG